MSRLYLKTLDPDGAGAAQTGTDLYVGAKDAERCIAGSPIRSNGDGSARWTWGFPCRNKSCPWCFANVWVEEHLRRAAQRFGRGVEVKKFPVNRTVECERILAAGERVTVDLPAGTRGVQLLPSRGGVVERRTEKRRDWMTKREIRPDDRSVRRAFLDELPPPPDRCDQHRHRKEETERACAQRTWWRSLFVGGEPNAYVYPLPDGRDLVVGNLRYGFGEAIPWRDAVIDAVGRMAVGQDPHTGLVYRVASQGWKTRLAPPEPGPEPPDEPERGDACTPPRFEDPSVVLRCLHDLGVEARVEGRILEWGPTTEEQWTQIVDVLRLRSLRHARWNARRKRREYYEHCLT